jgi:hypothetical protein
MVEHSAELFLTPEMVVEDTKIWRPQSGRSNPNLLFGLFHDQIDVF